MTSKHTDTGSHAQDETASTQPAPQAAPNNERIGDILRRVREHRGEDLVEIAEYLCIRRAYLYALEQSHYKDLPAEAYVIGFLRTYAAYLGLQGQGAIEQYRREMAGQHQRPNLSMPQPMSEGKAPTLALLAGATVAAIIIYGLWYGLSSPEEEMTKQPVSLPQSTTEVTLPSQTKEAEQSEDGTNATLLQETTSPGITLSVTGEDETALPPEAAKKMGVLVITATGKKEKEASPLKETPAVEEETKKEKRSFGYKGRTTVVLEAIKKTWILITDKKGLTVFDRTLSEGEKYKVRNNKGLHLTTGNASGLRFIVKGKALPPLKTDKRVVRAINLTPDDLKDRLD